MFSAEIAGCAVLGLVVGSFLNVVIYRVPRHLSVVAPRSACANCATPIRARDNIPVLSWILLRGRCRHCREPISPRYLVVEVLTGVSFVAVALRFGPSAPVPAYLVFVAGLIALSFIDAEHLVLPRPLVYGHAAAVVVLLVTASLVTHAPGRLVVAFVAAALWSGLFTVLNLVNPRWLGFGDVRFSLVLGFALGWLGVGEVVVGFFVANLSGVVVAGVLMALGRLDRRSPIPYGVFLSVGAVVALWFAPFILAPVHLS